MKVPPGMFLNVREGQNSWLWSVKRFGTVKAEGSARSEKEANRLAWGALKNLVSGPNMKEVNNARMKLRHYLRSRVYLVCHVVEFMLEESNEENICDEAEAGELAWWKKTPKEFREPLADSRGKKPASGAAKVLLEVFAALGMWASKRDDEGERDRKMKRLRAWAKKVLGEAFDGSEPVEDLEEDDGET